MKTVQTNKECNPKGPISAGEESPPPCSGPRSDGSLEHVEYGTRKTSTFTETRKLQLQLSTTTKWKWATFILVWFYDLKMLMKLQNYKIFLKEQNRCMFCYYCRLLKNGQLPATKLSMLNSQMIKAMQTLLGVLSISIPVSTRYRNYFVLTDIFHHYEVYSANDHIMKIALCNRVYWKNMCVMGHIYCTSELPWSSFDS